MPTYQYSCNDCGHFFEIVQSFSDDSLTVCPECEGRLRKVFNAVGVVFKGSGFYRTDSRNQKTGAEAGPGAGAGSREQRLQEIRRLRQWLGCGREDRVERRQQVLGELLRLLQLLGACPRLNHPLWIAGARRARFALPSAP